MKSSFCIAVLICIFSSGFAQNALQFNSGLVLPKDSTESKTLVSSIESFLALTQKTNEENTWVNPNEKAETYLLLDEIRGMEKSGKYKDDHFYKPYLINAIDLKNNQYLIQIAYIGNLEDTVIYRASFEFIATKNNDAFIFSSPLRRNTVNWKTEKIGNNIFHYKDSLNAAPVSAYTSLSSKFDNKLKVIKTPEFYCCIDAQEMQKLIGVIYKLDYNGRNVGIWSAEEEKRKVTVLGNNNENFNHFDTHDVWHDRLSLVRPRNTFNRSVDEGCAYLYGGSWGFSWEEIFKAFDEQIASNTETDWTVLKETPVYFKTGNYNNAADYIVNALWVKKIEAEKGFAGVWEFLNVEPITTDNEKYYATLEKLTGVTQENYNQAVWQLIAKEKN